MGMTHGRCIDCGWLLEGGAARGLLCTGCSDLRLIKHRRELARFVHQSRPRWWDRIDETTCLAVYSLMWVAVLILIFSGALS